MTRAFLIVPAAMCLLALLHLPYGYYQLLRLVVTASATFFVVSGWRSKSPVTTATFAVVALAYNPVFHLRLDRAVWEWVNIATAAIYLGALAVSEWRDRAGRSATSPLPARIGGRRER